MNGLTVLLAEDNDQQALLITQALIRSKGIGRVIHFQNGQEALNYLLPLTDGNEIEGKFVLLLDVQMPQAGGIEALRTVKNHDTIKALPVIMFSSTTDPQIIDLCYQYGCNAFISKPRCDNEFESLSMLDFISIMQVPAVPADIISKIASGEIK